MSRHLVVRYWRHAALLHSRRHYVGSRSEVEDYRREKKRALKWVFGFRYFPKNQEPTDAPAIQFALSRHLFDPLKRLPPPPSRPILARFFSLRALDTCQQMLRDLESYFTAKNIVLCCQRIGKILAYSERDIWIKDHAPCLQHLCEMVDLAIPRCRRPDLGVLIWSLGKWGPKGLGLKLPTKDRYVRDVVERILECVCDDGVQGEWDSKLVHQILNGCTQLNIKPNRRLENKIYDALNGDIECADADVLTRLIVDFSELKLPLPKHHLEGIAQSFETKLKAGTFPEKEIPVTVSCLAEWQYNRRHEFTELCNVIDTYIMQWSTSEWTLRQYVLLLEGFVKLRYFPSWPFIERIYVEAKRADVAKATYLWAVLLRTFAELAIRPVYVMDQCISLLEELEKSTVSVAPSDVCSILKSLALLCRLKSDLFWPAVQFLTPHLSDLTTEDKIALYLAHLDLKYLTDHSQNRQETSEDSYLLVLCRTAWRQQETYNQIRENRLFASVLQKKNRSRAAALQKTTVANGDISLTTFQQSSSENATVAIHPRLFYNAGGRITGSDLWRTRLYEKLGWKCKKISSTDGSEDV